MADRDFLGLAGACAVLAAVARGALILTPLTHLPPPVRETIYLLVDFGIVMGLFGLQMRFGERLGRIGLAGLLLALGGVLVIRTGERSLLGPSAYQVGAATLAIGCAVMSAPLLRRGLLERLIALAWLGSPAASVVAGFAGRPALGFALASALFSLGLFFAGVSMVKSRSARGGRRSAA